MFGLIGEIEAVPGKRDELADILAGIDSMPGCLYYVVATDAADLNVIWVTEIWVTRTAHEESLQLPDVQAAIGRGRPLIAGFRSQHEVKPVGGIGLGG